MTNFDLEGFEKEGIDLSSEPSIEDGSGGHTDWNAHINVISFSTDIKSQQHYSEIENGHNYKWGEAARIVSEGNDLEDIMFGIGHDVSSEGRLIISEEIRPDYT